MNWSVISWMETIVRVTDIEGHEVERHCSQSKVRELVSTVLTTSTGHLRQIVSDRLMTVASSLSLPSLCGPLQCTEQECTLSSGIINSQLYMCFPENIPLHCLVQHCLAIISSALFLLTKCHWSTDPFGYKTWAASFFHLSCRLSGLTCPLAKSSSLKPFSYFFLQPLGR